MEGLTFEGCKTGLVELISMNFELMIPHFELMIPHTYICSYVNNKMK